MKNSADLGGPSASVDNTLLHLQNSSYPTQPHSIIAKYCKQHELSYCTVSSVSISIVNNVSDRIVLQ